MNDKGFKPAGFMEILPHEAIEHSKRVHEDAKKERREYFEAETERDKCHDCSDKDKVIQALWELIKEFHYDKCDAIGRKCDGCALDSLCRAYTLSETLEQFTEKLLEGKE